MLTRLQIAQETARALRAADLTQFRGLMGFDGFVDDIIDVVAERHAVDRYDRISTLAKFAEAIAATAGHGCNFELVVKRQKLGGNGPIMGNALTVLGMSLTYAGAVGDGPSGKIHPVFNDFATRATLIPLCNVARTQALEFSDGKLMLGELAPLSEITWERLLERIGLEKLVALFEEATLLGLMNWTMVPHATAVWRKIGAEILPRLSAGKRHRIVVDLADPKKRSATDLADAMRVLETLDHSVPVTLGLNLAEAQQVSQSLGLPTSGQTPMMLAALIRGALNLNTVVIHPSGGAAMATASESSEFAGPYIREPRILTGGGDHFMAGFAVAQLIGLPSVNSLCLATAVSGYYVRQTTSPTVPQLAEFLQNFPEPQVS